MWQAMGRDLKRIWSLSPSLRHGRVIGLAGEGGGEPATGCRCAGVAEERWTGYQTRVNKMLRERMLAELEVQ